MLGFIERLSSVRCPALLCTLNLLALSLPRPAMAVDLVRTPIAAGLSAPVFVTAPRSDTTRLFVIEKPGRIRVIQTDSLLPSPFLDITDRVRAVANEQGLLGLAFHPGYDQNGYFFVNYTAQPDGRTVIARFKVSAGDPNLADLDSAKVILEVPQFQTNHNGGMIAFGPLDEYLYIGLGDGGSANDPGNRAQNPDVLLGKMLRIDIDVDSTYAIPPGNPFVLPDTARHEIWAFGLRNPWRWSFDRVTGDLWIADVGQGQTEEIDWQSASSAGGANYGWRLKEGTNCHIPSVDCDTAGLLDDPITQYVHSAGRCSITGGYVYRGCAIPELTAAYFYGDYCTGEIWSLRYDGVAPRDSTDHTVSLGLPAFDLASFGEDARGELYMTGLSSGTVWRVEPVTPVESCHGCPVDTPGDVNLSGVIDASDLVYLVLYVFKNGPGPLPLAAAGDVNCSGSLTAADVIYLVQFVFKSGTPPCDVCTLI